MDGYPRQGSDVEGSPSVDLLAVLSSKASLGDVNRQTRPEKGKREGSDEEAAYDNCENVPVIDACCYL